MILFRKDDMSGGRWGAIALGDEMWGLGVLGDEMWADLFSVGEVTSEEETAINSGFLGKFSFDNIGEGRGGAI